MPELRNIPAFPEGISTAKIPRIDFQALINGDSDAAQAVHTAASSLGFFYLINHGIDSSSMFGLASDVFQLSLDEKMKYDMGTTGHYFGYKRSGAMVVDSSGTRDHSQFYNISKNDMLSIGQTRSKEHPQAINESHAQVEGFMRSCHGVVDAVLQTLSTQLGLGIDTLRNLHQLSQRSGCQARLTHAPPLESGVVSVGEHTDFGSVTVLFNELGGLQVLSPDSQEWQYVKPMAGAAIINLGDALVKLVGGRLYSGLHRVVGPPGEQARCERHSVVYFCRPNSNVKLSSLFPEDEENKDEAMSSDDWIKHRAKSLTTAHYSSRESQKFFHGTAHNVAAGQSQIKPIVAAV